MEYIFSLFKPKEEETPLQKKLKKFREYQEYGLADAQGQILYSDVDCEEFIYLRKRTLEKEISDESEYFRI